MIIISSWIIWKIKLKYTFKKTNIAQFPQYIVLDNFWCIVNIVKTMSFKKKITRTNQNNQHILYKIDYHGINPGFSLSLVTTQLLDINKKHKMHNFWNQLVHQNVRVFQPTTTKGPKHQSCSSLTYINIHVY